MALRRVDSARLVHEPGWFGKGPFLLVLGRKEYLVGPKRKWSNDDVDQFWAAARKYPAWIATINTVRYWLYNGRIFSENERLDQNEVYALLVSRDQYNQRRVDRAVTAVNKGTNFAASSRRMYIPDEVRMYVFNRDGGRCCNCGSPSEIQFDHIIPIAMGGSSEPENLQLLCGPCNRAKGAGLTNRGVPPGAAWG